VIRWKHSLCHLFGPNELETCLGDPMVIQISVMVITTVKSGPWSEISLEPFVGIQLHVPGGLQVGGLAGGHPAVRHHLGQGLFFNFSFSNIEVSNNKCKTFVIQCQSLKRNRVLMPPFRLPVLLALQVGGEQPQAASCRFMYPLHHQKIPVHSGA